MAFNNPLIIRGHEIYVLTSRGNDELQRSETSLSPAEIELLVRIDGRSTVDQIKASARLLKAEAVGETMRKLVGSGLIESVSGRKTGDPGIIDFFGVDAPLNPSAKALARAKAAASDGLTTLQRHGYYVRIARHAAAARKQARTGSLTVIVVEDEPSLAKFLRHYLELDGFDVRLAANRDQIITAFRSPPLPDLVLLDVMLPDVDGFDVLLKMRAHPALKTVPVIMLTARATKEAVLKGLAGGADGYVTKPFEAEALVKAVRTVLGLPQDPLDQGATDSWLKPRKR